MSTYYELIKRDFNAHSKTNVVSGIFCAKSIGEISDGYHTFNELYHHRAILFSLICNQNASVAWKSKLHHDGTMFDGMFIVGINTPFGQATYHYDIEPYWDYFNVKALNKAPEWDGHTSDQAIDRILKFGIYLAENYGQSEIG